MSSHTEAFEWACAAFVGLVLCTTPVSADDLICLRQPNSDAVMSIPATIDDFTGRFITYHTSSGSQQASTSRVEGIRHEFSENFKRGQRLFESGNYEAAKAEWQLDLKKEPKRWVQREIRSWLVRAAWRQEHWAVAGQQFLAIVAEDPETIHWPIAPLLWTPGMIRDADRTIARDWLQDDRSVARLLAGSLLLKDKEPALRESAVRVLTSLVRDTSPQVSGLAKAQLWRNRFDQPISDSEVASWQGHLNYLPKDLRGGPQYLLGAAYLRRGEYDRAAAEFLWVPLMYPQHEPTAARASLEAGEALMRAARQDEALKTLEEAAANFGWSQAGRDAKSRVAELKR